MSDAGHRILIVGGGGREHALAWKLAASPKVAHVYVAPGNAGTARLTGASNVAIGVAEIEALRDFARDQAISLTVVGPEAPLAAGIVDVFRTAGLACFGPTAAAAQLEASKAFAKDFLARHAIPTAQYEAFADYASAASYIEARGAPVVIKADGLAAGKGVTLAHSVPEALAAAHAMLEKNTLGDAGARIVVEDFLAGEEASFIVMVDGAHILPLAGSQDHKTAYDGDTGPNTGGMGAYSPAPALTDPVATRVMDEIMEPAVTGLAAEGRPFTGFLYAGLMIDEAGHPRVLEFNVRMGDPEAQPLLMRLDSDLIDLLEAAVSGRLDQIEAHWRPEAALGVVMTAGGYPEAYTKGDPITGLEIAADRDVEVFHAGTLLGDDDRVRTAGGRVLCVCALGTDVAEAKTKAYQRVTGIDWPNVAYRHDIGHLAIDRPQPGCKLPD